MWSIFGFVEYMWRTSFNGLSTFNLSLVKLLIKPKESPFQVESVLYKKYHTLKNNQVQELENEMSQIAKNEL